MQVVSPGNSGKDYEGSWQISQESLLKSSGPVTDFLDGNSAQSNSAEQTLIAAGIGRESSLLIERQGICVEKVLAEGSLPFQVNNVWSLGSQVLVFDLLNISMTAVYLIDIDTGRVNQVEPRGQFIETHGSNTVLKLEKAIE